MEAICGICKNLLKKTLNYYELLEISQDTDQDEIKKAYRRLAIKWHPDKNPDKVESATEMFKMISEAYSVLSDSTKRSQYDSFINNASQQRSSNQSYSPHVDYEYAAQLFMNEMYNLAMELTFKNKNWKRIYPQLVDRGCPSNIAQVIAQSCEVYRKTVVRKRALKPFLIGLFWFALGALITLGSYSDASKQGGHYTVMWGAIAFGGYQMFKCLYYLISGAAPPKNYNSSFNSPLKK